jgi:hypothetical protein
MVNDLQILFDNAFWKYCKKYGFDNLAKYDLDCSENDGYKITYTMYDFNKRDHFEIVVKHIDNIFIVTNGDDQEIYNECQL